jgi:hypothetical protein
MPILPRFTRDRLAFFGSMLTHHDPRARSAHWSFVYPLILKGATWPFSMRENKLILTGVTRVRLLFNGQHSIVTASTR